MRVKISHTTLLTYSISAFLSLYIIRRAEEEVLSLFFCLEHSERSDI